MAGFQQRDLPPPNTTFTPESSNAAEPLRTLLIPLIRPGEAGAPFFNGNNVTEFLQNFKGMCEDSGVSKKNYPLRMIRYCDISVVGMIKEFTAFQIKDQEELKKKIKWHYRKYDRYQLMRSLGFLEMLKDSAITNVRQYCQLYKTSADHLIKTKRLSEYQCGFQFLQGLPKKETDKYIKQFKIKLKDKEEEQVLDFQAIYKAVLGQCDQSD